MSNLLTAFNDHFVEFLTDIQRVFPDDVDVLTAKNALLAIRKTNPKMIVKIWTKFIVGEYKKEIDAGDIAFFINKGVPPTLLKALTGELTPPGMDRWALSNNSMLLLIIEVNLYFAQQLNGILGEVGGN